MKKLLMKTIGLMSGTSMDGVDAALIETDGENTIQLLKTASIEYPTYFKLSLKKAEKNIDDLNLPELSLITRQSTDYHIQAIEKLGIDIKNIDLIGYHGQTLCHRPKEKISLQIGNPQQLANHFQIPVVFDFRQEDLCNGGQGAPLAPLYHQALIMQKKLKAAVIINCGGIANISVITGNRFEDIHAGFDTGPGNVLIDQYVRVMTNNKETYDKDGEYGLRGKINDKLIEKLFEKSIDQNYYQRPPPKSLDSQQINFIPEIQTLCPSIEDGCATLAAFTAYSIIDGIQRLNIKTPNTWILSGGGAKNGMIVKILKQLLTQHKCTLYTADEIGFQSSYMEAELMAWLAVRSLKKLPLSLPQTTGVKQPTSGGKIFQPFKITEAQALS